MPCRPQRIDPVRPKRRRGDVDAGDRLRRNNKPAHRRRRCRHRIEDPFLEQFGVGKKQRRIPAKQDQAGYETGIGIARDVVIAFDAVGAAQDRRVRPPAVPKELDDGDHDRQTDPWNGSQHGHTDEADNRQPEFPALDTIDSLEVGNFDQADRRGDDDRGQSCGGQMLEKIRRHQQQQGDGERADDAGHLRLGTGGLRNGRARRAAADREALEKSRGQIGRAKPHHLLVGVDVSPGPRRVGT